MKTITPYILTGFLALALCACEQEATAPIPVALDPAGISAEALPGAVKLKWTIPANADYKYVKVTYTIPDAYGQAKACMRMASIYADTLLVDNLLARFGDIDFTLQTCNPQGRGGETHTLTTRALPATKTIQTQVKNIEVAGFWADNPESSEGPLPNLFDGNTGSFYHMSWSAPSPWPHYIVVDLGMELKYFNFKYTCRDHNNRDNPSAIDVLVSRSLPANGPDYAGEGGTEKIATFAGLPGDKGASFESTTVNADTPFRYVWIKILGSTSGKNWVALSEMSFQQVERFVYDPETGETTVE